MKHDVQNIIVLLLDSQTGRFENVMEVFNQMNLNNINLM